MLSILKFELRYRLTRPATWIYGLIFFILGILAMSTDIVRIGGGYGKVFSNAPYNIHQVISALGFLGLFIIMAFFSVPVYRDFEHRTDTFLFAFPIKRTDYLAGRFLGTMLMCLIVYALLPIGMIIGELIARAKDTDASNWGPFNAFSYFWPMLVALLPGVFLLGSLFFSLVSLTRKMMYAYIVSISFIVLYSISINLLSEIDNKFLAGLLDPFGLTAAGNVTEYWSIAEKNQNLVPLTGVYLWNRLFWSSIGAGFLLLVFLRFRMSPVSDSGKAPKKAESKSKPEIWFSEPSQNWKPDFSQFRIFKSLLVLEIRQTIRNGIFLALLFATALYMVVDAWYADSSFETGIHPVTGIMLETVTSSLFGILSIAIIIFLAGEIVWRERQAKMEGIYDAFPTSNQVVFWSKFGALLVVPIMLLSLVPIVGMSIQAIKGYYHFEPGLYLQTIFLYELPRLWLIAALAFCIQNIMSNKYAGNVAILIYYLAFIGLSYLKIEHPLFRYGSGLSYRYSDMNGFGDSVRGFLAYLGHWSIVGLFLLAIGYLFLARGAESGFKARMQNAKSRLQNSKFARLSVFLPFLGMLFSGFYITKQTTQNDRFVNSKDRENAMVEYEKKFAYLARTLHPSLTSVKIEANMFPENGDLKLGGTFTWFNPHNKPIDTLWYNYQPEGKLTKMEISVPSKLVYQDSLKGIRAYKLLKPLAPGDSFYLNFGMTMAFNGFDNESPVVGNGTFFNNEYWPSVGFNEGYKLQDEDKREEKGLKKIPAMPSQNDSAAIAHSLFDYHNHDIRFEAVLSTSPDQIAIAPGYLQKEWMKEGRRYFHYKMDRPITNFYSIISARFQVYREKHNGIDIAVYHHPWHNFNVKKMAEAVRHSLDYYQANFGPYQHRQVRILEFPRYASFAQSFDNTIPYSEGIGFIADLEDKDAIDYVYFVTAHEMAHQWWGHQINPAFARGAQFLSETMAEYSALMVMRQRYGDELMGRFLRKELNSYLNGRSNETRKEDPLMDIEMQGYAYYNKGSLAMYNVMGLMGEEKTNQFLKDFVSANKFRGRPYPTTSDFYSMLKTRLNSDQLELANDQLKRITLYKNRMVSAKGKKLSNGLFEVRMKVELGKMYVDSLGAGDKKLAFKGSIQVALLKEQSPKVKTDVIRLESLLLRDGQEIVWSSKEKPVYAGLDPLNTLTDILPEDNRVKIDWE